jgi:hypothetical protein
MQSVTRNSILAVISAFSIAAILIALAPRVDAQPSSIAVEATSAASSTTSFMTAGTATTTYQLDSYPTYSSSKPFSMAGIDSVSMLLDFVSQGTATSSIGYQIQYSDNGIDWYGGNSLTSATPVGATGYFSLATSTNTVYWNPNSGTGANATTTNFTAVNLPMVSALHERVVFTIPIGAPAGAVYAEFVLKHNASGQ